jgi:hypothetical protein
VLFSRNGSLLSRQTGIRGISQNVGFILRPIKESINTSSIAGVQNLWDAGRFTLGKARSARTNQEKG